MYVFNFPIIFDHIYEYTSFIPIQKDIKKYPKMQNIKRKTV